MIGLSNRPTQEQRTPAASGMPKPSILAAPIDWRCRLFADLCRGGYVIDRAAELMYVEWLVQHLVHRESRVVLYLIV
jgi:hypothetical protein